MSDQRPLLPPAPSRTGPAKQGPKIPITWVVGGLVGLIVLALTFYAGMSYEDHRIKKAFEDAFSGFGDSSDSNSTDSDSEPEAEPVELVEGSPTEVSVYDGTLTYTLEKQTFTDEPASDKKMDRNLAYVLRIENTGDKKASPTTSTHFETDSGQVLDFSGVFCAQDDLPYQDLNPGQFVEGCESSDLPADGGRLIFDSTTPQLFISVPPQ